MNNIKTKTKFTIGQSNAISDIRALAVVSILATHFLQYFGEPLAWWLNVGVQVFLFMSGFLLGSGNIAGIKTWYGKKLQRILIPYYIYLLIIIPVYLIIIGSVPIGQLIGYALNLQVFTGYISGLEHLWYVTIIMICYFLTPMLQKLNISSHKYNEFVYYFLLFAFCSFIQAMLLLIPVDLNPWIVGPNLITYILGYYTSRRYNLNVPFRVILMLSAITLIFVLLNFVTVKFNSIVVDILHILLGCLIFLSLYYFIPLFSKKRENYSLIRFVNTYSYEIYITHHLYIIGAMSLMTLTDIKLINILTIVVIVSCSSIILNKVQGLGVKLKSLVLNLYK